VTCLPMQLPRGRGSSIDMIAVMCTSHKKDPGPKLAGVFLAVRGTSALEQQFHIVMAIGAVKLPTVAPETALRHFISTVTFSVLLHKLHSKVRTSGTPGPDTTPVSIIGPWHFGHGGRSISTRRRSAMRDCGMCCSPKIRRERDALCHR
jgi:hypothetical protein